MKLYKSFLYSVLAVLATGATASANTHRIHHHAIHTKVSKVYNVKQLKRALNQKGGYHHRNKIVLMRNIIQPNHKNRYEKNTGYNLKQYISQYNPKVYGKHRKTTGLMEDARKRAENNQKKDVEVKVPAYTTISAVNHHSVSGINFITNGSHINFNHLTIHAPIDDFPQWDGTDGKDGNWNSAFDTISIKKSSHDAVRNSVLNDGAYLDGVPNKQTFNRQYQQHDGLTDITNGSNYITLSHNTYQNHDKAILIGNSDKRTSDKGKLNVWLKGNKFINVSQRMPRLRFGHVHLNNNHIYSNNLTPYSFIAGFENGKDGHMTGYGNTFNIKNVTSKQLLKNAVQNKQGKQLSLGKTIINGKVYNINLKHNKLNMKLIKQYSNKVKHNNRRSHKHVNNKRNKQSKRQAKVTLKKRRK